MVRGRTWCSGRRAAVRCRSRIVPGRHRPGSGHEQRPGPGTVPVWGTAFSSRQHCPAHGNKTQHDRCQYPPRSECSNRSRCCPWGRHRTTFGVCVGLYRDYRQQHLQRCHSAHRRGRKHEPVHCPRDGPIPIETNPTGGPIGCSPGTVQTPDTPDTEADDTDAQNLFARRMCQDRACTHVHETKTGPMDIDRLRVDFSDRHREIPSCNPIPTCCIPCGGVPASNQHD